MAVYKVAVEYRSWGVIEVEADSKEDLIAKLKDDDFVEELPLPLDPEYIGDTTEVDFNSIEDYN